MFSGIIQQRGTLIGRDHDKLGLTVRLKAQKAKRGDSVAVNGVCLTVAKQNKRARGLDLYFQLSPETLQKTTLGDLPPGTRLNIEKPLSAAEAFGGHIVQGHVDGVGRVEKIIDEGESKKMWYSAPPPAMDTLVPKGSVAIDGISLTVVDLSEKSFSVALIPYTLDNTNLGSIKVGDPVNLEADIIGKYVYKYIRKP
ncbi:MAG: riboflavin synthase [Elusimicrobia bacterium]|nr:riboflavin synthase [Candidatus Obscuribacterium magneticum]